MTLGRLGSIGALIACVLAICGCSDSRPSGPSARVRQHAITAGNVMTRSHGPLPARAVALSVTGKGVDDTIDALVATGTTWGGSVTLRITVSDQAGALGSGESATACYRYRFTYPRQSDWGEPHQVDCGNAAPIDLSNPPLPNGITVATRQAVLAAVHRLTPAQQAMAGVLTASIRAALGPFYTIAGETEGRGAFVRVRYGDACLSVDTSASPIRVSQPVSGPDCFGG